jgi:hypothetical protein
MALIPNAANRFKPAVGFVGRWANMEEDNARTGIAGAEFAGGVPLTYGTAEGEFVPLTTGKRFVGVSLSTVDMYGTPTADGAPTFKAGDIFGIADMGTMFVLAGASVTEGASAFYEVATRKYHGATATGRLPLPNVEFDFAAADGQPVGLRIRINPGQANVTAAT